MSVYRIDINVGGKGSAEESKSNLTSAATLGLTAAGLTSAALDPFHGTLEKYGLTDRMRNAAGTWQMNRGFDDYFLDAENLDEYTQNWFFFRTRHARYTADIVGVNFEEEGEGSGYSDTLDVSTAKLAAPTKASALYALGLASKVSSSAINNTLRWNAATATSTTQRQTMNSFHNAMNTIGLGTSIFGYAAAGAAVGGPIGGVAATAVAIGTAVWDASVQNNIRLYESKINHMSSEAQMIMLGDATYGRSRGD